MGSKQKKDNDEKGIALFDQSQINALPSLKLSVDDGLGDCSSVISLVSTAPSLEECAEGLRYMVMEILPALRSAENKPENRPDKRAKNHLG